MSNLKRVDSVVAAIELRDEQMEVLTQSFEEREGAVFVSAKLLGNHLGYRDLSNFMRCVNQAKIGARRTGRKIADNFVPANLFDAKADADDIWLTPWAAFASIMEADVSKPRVAAAKSYFAALANADIAAGESRLKERQLFKQSHKELHGAAEKVGISGKDHAVFDDHGYRGMYKMGIRQVEAKKGVPRGKVLVDCAGATEIAANNLRMAMMKGSLDKGEATTKNAANKLYKKKGEIVRQAVKRGTGMMPEDLPLEDKTIDELSVQKQREMAALENHGS